MHELSVVYSIWDCLYTDSLHHVRPLYGNRNTFTYVLVLTKFKSMLNGRITGHKIQNISVLIGVV